MRILVACETSGLVREAFRKLGHEAWSCDLLPPDDDSAFHYQDDCVEVLNDSDPWGLIIMHPPCTALAVSGNRWYGKGMPMHDKRIEAIEWTMSLWNLAKENSTHVCMENPVGALPLRATQYIQPWMFGHGETKRTGLWLHNLLMLQPTHYSQGREQRIWKMGPSPERAKERSKTFEGVANAMAAQWAEPTGLLYPPVVMNQAEL